MDQQVMQNFLRRMARIGAEVKSVNPETEGKKLCEKLCSGREHCSPTNTGIYL
jgi:hypothetical protein